MELPGTSLAVGGQWVSGWEAHVDPWAGLGSPPGHRAPHCSDSRCLMRLWGAEQSRTFGPRTEPGSQEIRTEPSNSECSFIIKTNLIH